MTTLLCLCLSAVRYLDQLTLGTHDEKAVEDERTGYERRQEPDQTAGSDGDHGRRWYPAGVYS